MSGEPTYDAGRSAGSRGKARDSRATRRLHAALDKRVRAEAALAELSLLGLRVAELRPLLESAAALLPQVLGLDISSVFELSADGAELRLVAAHGRQAQDLDKRISAGTDTAAGAALRRHLADGRSAPEVLDSVRIADLYPGSRGLVALGVRSGIAAVIPGTPAPYGVLEAFSLTRGSFDRTDIEFVQSAANVIGAAAGRVRAEAALRESEARYRSLTELTADFYWDTDAEHRIVHIEGSGLKRLGFPAEVVIGKARWEFDTPNMTEADWAKHRAEVDARREFRDLVLGRINPQGAPKYVRVSGRPVFDAAGVFLGYRGVGTDITEEQRAEEALRGSEARYRELFDAAPNPLYVYDRETLRILEVNDHAVRQYGWSREELLGLSMLDLRPPEERPVARAAAVAAPVPFERRPWRHWRKGGEPFDVEATTHDLEYEGRPARLVSVIDVSARELHDRAGQNLTALAINLEVLRKGEGCAPPAEYEQRLRDSIELTKATAALIDDVTAELRPATLDELGLAAALHSYARQQAVRTGLAVDVRVPDGDGPAPLPARDLALFRIVQEAVNNVVRHAHAKTVTIELNERAAALELSVRDDGRGMPSGADEHGRARLGLRGMRERAMAIDADLEIVPAPGGGTLVRVRVPRPAQ